MSPMDALRSTLAAHFGFEAFRPGQRPVIEALLGGRHVVAVMPTGFGKSLCYQLPALCLDGVTLVVSPLISLMKDQVDALRARGIAAAYVNSTQDPRERHETLAAAARGELRLLYVAPERFRNEAAMAALRQLPLDLFVVDEAHCMSQWGHDFRPDYLTLGQVAQHLGAPRIGAFTATATSRVRADIVSLLGLRDPIVTVSGFLRDNLHLSVVPIRRMVEKDRHMTRLIRDAGGPCVVYCATRRHCEEVAVTLAKQRIASAVYHGGLDDSERHRVQDLFAHDEVPVIVATNAFGMGIDKSDVRAVIHYDLPGSLEAYYQEAGRAGRDGQRARCVLLFTYADTRIHEFFISQGGLDLPPAQRAARADREQGKLKAMVRYAYEEGCRHSSILRYFGERLTIGPDGCGACDRCTGETGVPDLATSSAAERAGGAARRSRGGRASDHPPRDMTEAESVLAQKALSAVARSRGRLTVVEIARVLRGSRRAEVLADPLAETRSFGILAHLSHAAVTSFLEALRRAGCMRGGARPELTHEGVEVMWRRRTVMLDVPEVASKAQRREAKGASTGAASAPLLDGDQREVLEALKAIRLDAAREREVPAYRVATNRVLEALVRAPPDDDRDAWLGVKGIGPSSVDPLRELFSEALYAQAEAAPGANS